MPATRAKKVNKGKKKKEEIKFSKRLVLFHYFLDLLGFNDFLEAQSLLNKADYIGIDSANNHRFLNIILSSNSKLKISEEELVNYDQNIVRATNEISEKRSSQIQWQYFQYLSILFTEIYLDRYHSNPESLLQSLNKYGLEFADKLNSSIDSERFKEYRFESYILDDLKKIALWSATGSGKTLLMHMHIKQTLYYLEKHDKRKEYNQILIITPNEALSKQHSHELSLSGIKNLLFTKEQGGMYKDLVKIIEITKLAEQSGDKTVAVDCFESNNLLFVDEGHRGSSGEEWSSRRAALASNGFTFEYSATFSQAISKNKKLDNEYSKAIIFDYSYKHFYTDGYGKDYKILNINEDLGETKYKYLIACLLSYYQQKKIYLENTAKAKRFNIENPLWVFVGHSVNAVREEKKVKVSDVVDVLLFLAKFTSEKEKQNNCKIISELLSQGLAQKDGRNVFSNYFAYLNKNLLKSEEIFIDVLKSVFNSDSPARIRVEDIKDADGEISLSLGATSQAFGVINVGDSKKLLELIGTHEDLILTDTKNFSRSLFHSINKESSEVNILIGSKKFTEGWNSYRVSTMGLLNIGQKEGTQIIQLFGRGVRLKGYPDKFTGSDYSLKRHKHLKYLGLELDKDIEKLETLNIFGLKADYMNVFKEYLEDEEISPEEDEYEEIIMPVIADDLKDAKLKIPTLKEGIDFKRDKEAPKPTLKYFPEVFEKMNSVSLNYYPKIDYSASAEMSKAENYVGLNQASLNEEHLAFLDFTKIYFDLQNFKNEKNWFNLNININSIYSILKNNSWYSLYIPKDYLDFSSGFKYLDLWQDIAQILMRKYVEKFYLFYKNQYESKHREYKELDENSENLLQEYQILINKEHEDLIEKINGINHLIQAGQIPSIDQRRFSGGEFLFSDFHLYKPLIFVDGKSNIGDSVVVVRPTALNKGEKEFVEKLENFAISKPAITQGAKLYLLRNQSRGKGLSIWEAKNFYPDFIFWIVKDSKQFISFIDPKGIRNMDISDAKIQLHKEIKVIEKEMEDESVILNSFILSVKSYDDLSKQWLKNHSEKEMKENHILFLPDEDVVKQLVEKILTLNDI